jgi:TonB family protein
MTNRSDEPLEIPVRRPFALQALSILALLSASSLAFAQAPPDQKAAPPPDQKAAPPPDQDTAAVPRGPGGALIKPPPQPAPDAAEGQVTMPRPLNYTPPVYPPEAEKAGLEANVTLQLDIDKQGKVLRAAVVDPAGHGFDEAAVAAAQKLEFAPARRADGTPFAARILYRYAFTLKKVEPTPEQANQAAEKATQSLRGMVMTAEGDAPIAGARVTVKRAGEVDDATEATLLGAFTFDDLPAGTVSVTISAPGYEPLTVDETLAKGESTEVKYRLIPKGDGIEVVIRGARPPREVVKRTLEQREISRIPGTNGDALRSIQSLPGVARPPGLAGLLIVRGSGPQDTQTFIDGTPVPLIYHFGGLSSVVPTELLDKIDFYPGNYSSQYGRVQGAIVDAGLRAPKNDKKYHGLAQLDLIDARVLFEGPIPLLKGWNFAVAGRRSWIDAWLGPVLKATGASVTQAPVYYDYQLMVQNNPTPDSSLRIAAFGSDDSLKLLLNEPAPGEPALSGNIGLHTAFQRIQVRYRNDLPGGHKIGGVFSLGQDVIEFGLSSLFFKLNAKSANGRFEYTHRVGKGISLNTGLDVVAGYYDVAVRLPPAPAPGEPPNQPFSTRNVVEQRLKGGYTFPAAYLELELAPTARAKLVPGVRVDYFNITNRFDFSPRVNGRYELFPDYPKTTLKAGLGIFHQPPQFQEVSPGLGNPKLASNRAIHYALGAEQEITKRIEGSVEGFVKQLDNVVVGVANTQGGGLEYKNVGRGYVVGSEFLLKYKPDNRFFGWVAYTLSRSARTNGPGLAEGLVPFDQTHILTVLGSYRLGSGWEFGARFRLISGNLVTPFVCNASSESCDRNRTNALFHAASGVYTPIPSGSAFSERLPLFHQLDMRLDKRWQFKSWALSTYLDIQNVYNRGNVEAISYNFNYTTRNYVKGLPILPSIGIRGEL